MEMPASLIACLSDTASVSSIACVIACPLCRPFLNRKPERSQHTKDACPTRGARRSPPLDWLARPDAGAAWPGLRTSVVPSLRSAYSGSWSTFITPLRPPVAPDSPRVYTLCPILGAKRERPLARRCGRMRSA